MISVTLPSLRPKAVAKRIKEFTSEKDYEIIVVSPFFVKDAIYIRQDPIGCVAAHALAFKCSRGDYIAFWADDTAPTPGCLSNMVDFVKGKGLFIGSFRVKDRRGRELAQWTINGKLYAGFGCASRETFEKVGYFDPVYRSYFADPDLSMKVWQARGRVEVCPDAWVITEGISDKVTAENSKYFERDRKTFISRWGEFTNAPIGKNIFPRFSIQRTLLNRLLVLYARKVPARIQGCVRRIKNCCLFNGHEYYLCASPDEEALENYPPQELVTALVEHKWKGTTPYYHLECVRCWRMWGEYHPGFHGHLLKAQKKGFVGTQEETRRFKKLIGREDVKPVTTGKYSI